MRRPPESSSEPACVSPTRATSMSLYCRPARCLRADRRFDWRSGINFSGRSASGLNSPRAVSRPAPHAALSGNLTGDPDRPTNRSLHRPSRDPARRPARPARRSSTAVRHRSHPCGERTAAARLTGRGTCRWSSRGSGQRIAGRAAWWPPQFRWPFTGQIRPELIGNDGNSA